MQVSTAEYRFGIVGGLGRLGSADLFFKLVQVLPASPGEGQAGLLFEQRPFNEGLHPGAEDASQNGRKLYVFDLLRSYESRGAKAILLPCFLCHTFLPELQAEVKVPIVDMMAAIRADIAQNYPNVRTIGVLASDYVRHQKLFEKYFDGTNLKVIYPSTITQAQCVMAAIYGLDGLKNGGRNLTTVDMLVRAARELVDQGADLIVPGFSEIPAVIDALRAQGFAVLDSNQVYVRAAMAHDHIGPRPIRIGVVGGVGPAATVDFLGKVVRNTPATKDQDHIKMVIEQNPQIPDRTGNILAQGPDPTIALYATCKRLESEGANAIAIPCNTAHAFVERIQPYLSIPILNMLTETVRFIVERYGVGTKVGLLATSGTVQSRVYHAAAAGQLELVTPSAEFQQGVMEAIYGADGVKAGYTTGPCAVRLRAAIADLTRQDVKVHILGCTELPLIFPQYDHFAVNESFVALVDPTEILAKRCVQHALRLANVLPL